MVTRQLRLDWYVPYDTKIKMKLARLEIQLRLSIRILVIRINWFGRIFFPAAKILLAI